MLDTGTSSRLTTFKYDFFDDYKLVDIGVKVITRGGYIVTEGRILRKCKTCHGSKMYLPTQGYHIPKANIHLESPQSISRVMCSSDHVIVGGWTIG